MVTPEIIDYVKQQRAAGYRDDVIKDALRKASYTETMIEDIMRSVDDSISTQTSQSITSPSQVDGHTAYHEDLGGSTEKAISDKELQTIENIFSKNEYGDKIVKNEGTILWTITPTEAKRLNFRLAVAFTPLVFLMILWNGFLGGSLMTALIMFGIFIGLIGVILLIMFLVPYPIRTYAISSEGISITKGKKKGWYTWNEFSYFYSVEYAIQPVRGFNFHLAEGGMRFMLCKKNSLRATAVVVIVEPDIADTVKASLSIYLREEDQPPPFGGPRKFEFG